MTALLEPWLAGRRFSWRDVLLGIAVLPGVALVVGGVPDDMHLGIAVGALSALLVAIFGSLNKRFVERGEPLAITARSAERRGGKACVSTCRYRWSPDT